MLRTLVNLFDCDEGQSEAFYNHVCEMISIMLGALSAEAFSTYIDACDDRFYLKAGSADKVWHKILDYAY